MTEIYNLDMKFMVEIHINQRFFVFKDKKISNIKSSINSKEKKIKINNRSNPGENFSREFSIFSNECIARYTWLGNISAASVFSEPFSYYTGDNLLR